MVNSSKDFIAPGLLEATHSYIPAPGLQVSPWASSWLAQVMKVNVLMGSPQTIISMAWKIYQTAFGFDQVAPSSTALARMPPSPIT